MFTQSNQRRMHKSEIHRVPIDGAREEKGALLIIFP